jgi:hypothetical protein
MKLGKIANQQFQEALDRLYEQSLPVKTAFKLKGAMKTVREEFVKYEDIRNKALNKYGKKDENDKLILDSKNQVQFDGDNLKDFIKEINDLSTVDVDIATIKMSELGDNINVSIKDLEALDGLIVED